MTTPQIADRASIRQGDRSTNEQDRFLDYCIRNRVTLTVILESGLPLIGVVIEHDRKALLLGPVRSNKDIRFIEKSYISMIRANEILPLFLEYKGRGNHATRKKARKEKTRLKAATKAEGKGNSKKLVLRRPKTPCQPK